MFSVLSLADSSVLDELSFSVLSASGSSCESDNGERQSSLKRKSLTSDSPSGSISSSIKSDS